MFLFFFHKSGEGLGVGSHTKPVKKPGILGGTPSLDVTGNGSPLDVGRFREGTAWRPGVKSNSPMSQILST